MKRKIKDEDKEYLVIKDITSPTYIGSPTPNVKLFYFTEEELLKIEEVVIDFKVETDSIKSILGDV